MDLLKHIEDCRRSIKIKRIEEEHRFYEITKENKVVGKFPSITTVLGYGEDNSFLDEWRKRIGEEEADRISRKSRERGTVMHRFLELYLTDKERPVHELYEQIISEEEHEDFLLENIDEGLEFFNKFLNNSEETLDRVKRPLSLEGFHYTNSWGGVAGTCDSLLELNDGKVIVVDFKNSRKPKQSAYIDGYFRQCAGYSVMIKHMYGNDFPLHGCEIWMANEIDDKPQVFTMVPKDIYYYGLQLKEKVKKFHNEYQTV